MRNIRTLPLVLLMLCCLSASLPSQAQAGFNEDLDAATAAEKRRDYSAARQSYSRVIASPAFKTRPIRFQSLIYYLRGHTFDRQEQYEQAIADYSEALRSDPNTADAYARRGCAYAKLEDRERAFSDLNQAIAQQSKMTEKTNLKHAYVSRGKLELEAKEYAKTITDIDQALRIDTEDCHTCYQDRGEAHYMLGHYNEAISDFGLAIRLAPDDAISYSFRGAAHKKMNMSKPAKADFAEAVRVKPGLIQLYFSARALQSSLKGDVLGKKELEIIAKELDAAAAKAKR